jgi:hypothetical protein
MSYLNCPACHLSLSAKRTTHEDCPRCLRRDGQHVRLFSSQLPYRLLAGSLAKASEPSTRATLAAPSS